MADSNNSRTLSSVTRRSLLKFASGTLAARSATYPAVAESEGDPALSLWRKWQAANQRAVTLGRRQARLERRLLEIAGRPHIQLAVPGQAKPVIVSTGAEIGKWLSGDTDMADARARARAELATKHRVWRHFDQRLGYSKAQAAESDAQDDEDVLLETFWATPARTGMGVAGKLHAMLKTGEPREGSPEFPWPQIRLLLIDLLRIDSASSDSKIV